MPDDIVTALVGRVWPWVVQAVASFDGLGRRAGRPSPGTLLTKHTRTSIPRTASWTVRRISERRAEQRVNRVLNEEFDPNTLAPEELARNQADRETFFSLVGDWRSELALSPRGVVIGQARGHASGHWYCSRWRSWASR